MPLLLAKQSHGFATQKGSGKPPDAHDGIVRYGTYKTYITQNSGFALQAGRGWLAPPFLRHKATVLCRKQKLWTQIYDLLLDHDTCLTPEAQN